MGFLQIYDKNHIKYKKEETSNFIINDGTGNLKIINTNFQKLPKKSYYGNAETKDIFSKAVDSMTKNKLKH